MRARNFLDDSNTVERRVLGRPHSFTHDGSHLGFLPKQRKRLATRLPSIKVKEKSLWAFQVPSKIIYSTAGIFLILPLFLFVWKETHITGRRGAIADVDVNRTSFTRLKRTKNAAWMEENLLDESGNTTSDGILPIEVRNNLTNGTNVTSAVGKKVPIIAVPTNTTTPLSLDKASAPKLGLDVQNSSKNATTDKIAMRTDSLLQDPAGPKLRS